MSASNRLLATRCPPAGQSRVLPVTPTQRNPCRTPKRRSSSLSASEQPTRRTRKTTGKEKAVAGIEPARRYPFYLRGQFPAPRHSWAGHSTTSPMFTSLPKLFKLFPGDVQRGGRWRVRWTGRQNHRTVRGNRYAVGQRQDIVRARHAQRLVQIANRFGQNA